MIDVIINLIADLADKSTSIADLANEIIRISEGIKEISPIFENSDLGIKICQFVKDIQMSKHF